MGFIYADGFVGEHNDCCIALSDKCKDNYKILNLLKTELQSDINIRHIIDKDGNGNYTLKFTNKKIVSDLNDCGVFTKKSLNMTYMPNFISSNIFNHFVRGYFDGDGTICTYYDSYDKRVRYCMEILGTKEFLSQLQEVLCNECNIKQTQLHDVKRIAGLTRISHRGIKSLIKIREYLYKNATIYLTYKHDRFFNIQPL